MRELLPGIWSWSVLSEPHGYTFNGFLIRRPEGNIVIDPVEPSEDDRAALVLGGARTVLLTNRNHSRRANLVRERTGAVVLMHAADAPHARAQGTLIDAVLAPGQRIGPLMVVPTPGKSPGEVVLHWPERRLLFIGDAVIGNPPGALSLLPDRVVDDPPLLRRSVHSLVELGPETLLLADGTPLVGDAVDRLRDLVAGFPD